MEIWIMYEKVRSVDPWQHSYEDVKDGMELETEIVRLKQYLLEILIFLVIKNEEKFKSPSRINRNWTSKKCSSLS